ncbi:MAG TPA: hypothetical protein VNO33_05260 [Kofleriaceae bacterium]|nr:hypothetical protein [Kofleriaceae bacterium]
MRPGEAPAAALSPRDLAALDAAIEAEMDRVLMDSFPASDPPQWDSISQRSGRAHRRSSGPRRSE